MPYIKNPKGRIVDVEDDAAVYLLSDNPKKTIDGREIKNNRGEPVKITKAEHEKGFTKPTDAEIAAYLKKTAAVSAEDAAAVSAKKAEKAEKEQKKADEVKAEADKAKAEADAKAKQAGGAGTPTPDN